MEPLLFMYYEFLRAFRREPEDPWDFFDGLDALVTKLELEIPEGK